MVINETLANVKSLCPGGLLQGKNFYLSGGTLGSKYKVTNQKEMQSLVTLVDGHWIHAQKEMTTISDISSIFIVQARKGPLNEKLSGFV